MYPGSENQHELVSAFSRMEENDIMLVWEGRREGMREGVTWREL